MTEISKKSQKVMSQADLERETAQIKETREMLWNRGALYKEYDLSYEEHNEKKSFSDISNPFETRMRLKDALITLGVSVPGFVLLFGGFYTTVFTYRAHHNRQMPSLPQKVTDQMSAPQQSGIIRVYE